MHSMKKGKHQWAKYRVWVWSLVILAIFVLQLRNLWTGYIWPTTSRIRGVMYLPAVERSAALRGDTFAEYVRFLSEAVPERADAKIILPPHSFRGVYSEIGYMQYFLFPRLIDNCEASVEKCIQRLTGPNSYILRIPGFPPEDLNVEHKQLITQSDDFGVFAPSPGIEGREGE